jgi:hypothetical protein
MIGITNEGLNRTAIPEAIATKKVFLIELDLIHWIKK